MATNYVARNPNVTFSNLQSLGLTKIPHVERFLALRTDNLHHSSISSHFRPIKPLPLQALLKANVILTTKKVINLK